MSHSLVDYRHDANQHSLDGARTALPLALCGTTPSSLLDVGCGRGTWLRSAIDLGIADVLGLDGADIPSDQLLFPPNLFRRQDLTAPWSLGRKFDVVLCLEVAEHIPESFSKTFVNNLTEHGDTVVFSAACPGQVGQHHVNLQWPAYWQRLFNNCGFVCDDRVRWEMWDIKEIEPWYRQNMFVARKTPSIAGSEPRICSVLHPQLLDGVDVNSRERRLLERIRSGLLPVRWYLTIPFVAFTGKVRRISSRVLRESHGSS